MPPLPASFRLPEEKADMHPSLLHDLLDSAAERWPGNVALTAGEQRRTWADLAADSHRLAAALHAAGVRRGDRVVATATGGTDVPALVFGASRIGAAFTILHDQTHRAGLAHVLDDCAPALLVTDVADLDLARERGIAATTPALLAASAADPAPGSPGGHAPWAGPGPLPVDPVCLIYTSGTTALPKAVVSTHQQAVFAVGAIQAVLGYRPDDVVFCALPLSFDYGLYQVFLAAASGAQVHLAGAASAGPALLRTLRDSGATVLPAVPSLAETLAVLARRRQNALPRLRLLTNTGAAIAAETLAGLRAALPGLTVQVMYGLTECKRTTIMPPDGDLDRPGSCGRALPGTEVAVLDPAGTPLPAGEVGELVVRGPNVMAGYWRRPELTAEKFPRREGLLPELRTGDYGWVDADGYVYFEGRRDDLYKERGFRVSATEVEAAAHRVPGVRSAAVVPPVGKRPSVLAVVGDVDAETVLDALRGEIEEYKIPRRCVVLADLPLSVNGKVDRKRLAADIMADDPTPAA